MKTLQHLSGAILFLLFVCGSAGAVEGYVDEVRGTAEPGKAFVIIRYGKKLAGTTDMRLQRGDIVELQDDKAVVTIRYSTGKTVSLRKGAKSETSFAIVDDREQPLSKRVITWIQQHFTSGSAQQVPAASKGLKCANTATDFPEKFDIPVMTPSELFLSSKERSLYFPWQGGLPPYSVTLVKTDGGEVVAGKKVERSCEVLLDKMLLQPGTYEVKIVDSLRAEVAGGPIVVVAPGKVPPVPEELKAEELPEDLRALYYAIWLGSQENGRWRLEALQQLVPVMGTSETVRAWLNSGGFDLQ